MRGVGGGQGVPRQGHSVSMESLGAGPDGQGARSFFGFDKVLDIRLEDVFVVQMWKLRASERQGLSQCLKTLEQWESQDRSPDHNPWIPPCCHLELLAGRNVPRSCSGRWYVLS